MAGILPEAGATVRVEVLSPPTEGYDRGEKFRRYHTLDSLRACALVATRTPLVEVFVRTPGRRRASALLAGYVAFVPPNPRFVEALRRLNPGQPPMDEEYIPRDAAAGRGWNMLERVETLLEAGVPVRALMHGCTGIGKSTELGRWARALGERAVLVRVRENLGEAALETVGSTVLGEEGLAKIPHDWLTGRSQEALVRELSGALAGRVVLIDGPDLLGADRIAEAFGPDGHLFWGAVPNFVATVPHTWALTAGPSKRHESIESVWHLPPLGVVDENGNEQVDTVDRVVAGLLRRVDATNFESPDLLRRIAVRSGGVPRHAVILLRQSILAAVGKDVVRAEHVLEAERELRQDLLHAAAGKLNSPNARLAGAWLHYEGRDARFERPHPLLA